MIKIKMVFKICLPLVNTCFRLNKVFWWYKFFDKKKGALPYLRNTINQNKI